MKSGSSVANRKLITVAFAVSALLGLAAEAVAAGVVQRTVLTKPTFVVKGRGWGHGVGLSQYGAYGLARRGTSYDRILAHYYPGTTLGPAPVSKVRVLIAEGRKSLTISSEGLFRVRDGDGKLHVLAPGSYTFGGGLSIKVKGEPKPKRLPGPLLFSAGASAFSAGTSPLSLGRPYRGQIQVISEGAKLHAINVVDLEAYLYGVVPSEVPTEWPAEALKAQAVVARSYALSGRKTGAAFDLYADTRSQMYLGIREEERPTNDAVDATAGKVLLYRGEVARTYYHSTSGGKTAAIADAWPGSPPLPYLVSVPDPGDALSPHHQWGPFVFAAKKLAAAVKARGKLLDVTVTPNSSGRAHTVTARTTLGQWTALGNDVRRALGLRSTWFNIGTLALAHPAKPAVFGSRLGLSGVARGIGAVTLEERPAGGSWRELRTVSGSNFTTPVRPEVTTYYRLTAGDARSGVVRVIVAPFVRLSLAPAGTAAWGVVRPLVPGAKVEIQRLAGPRWRTVARTSVDAKGKFDVEAVLDPGSYRARVVPGRGLVPGTSAPVDL
jgi:stage II sporulation protein D